LNDLAVGLQVVLGTELVVVEESAEEAHDFGVDLLLHGDEQDSSLYNAEVLNK
jgi:hypothetical protein